MSCTEDTKPFATLHSSTLFVFNSQGSSGADPVPWLLQGKHHTAQGGPHPAHPALGAPASPRALPPSQLTHTEHPAHHKGESKQMAARGLHEEGRHGTRQRPLPRLDTAPRRLPLRRSRHQPCP